jgi:hypothetical protein
MRIRRQLGQAAGLVGYTLNAGLARKTFWTFSIWEHQASLDKFAASDPHRAIIGRLRPRMSPTRFEFFPISGSDLPRPRCTSISTRHRPRPRSRQGSCHHASRREITG